jgi:hypothetical protein
MNIVEIGMLAVLTLMSLYSCLDHIFVPKINKRLDRLEKEVKDLSAGLKRGGVTNANDNKRGHNN